MIKLKVPRNQVQKWMETEKMTETNDSRVTGSKKNLFHLPQRRLS